MNQRGAFLINGYHLYPGHSHFLSRLGEELKSLGIAMDILKSTDVYCQLNEAGEYVFTSSLNYDFIVVLDKDKYILEALEAKGIRLFNSSYATSICDDKMLTYMALSRQGIPMPRTISFPLNYARKNHELFFAQLKKNFAFPFVAKTNFGSMGTGVHLIHNDEELNGLIPDLDEHPYLFQEYIASSSGFDDRLILIGGKFFCGYRRHGKEGEFRSNISNGGYGEKKEIDPAYIALAEEAAQIIGLDYCGIDILTGENKQPVLCEVNSNAFFAGAEKVTGQNIAGAYAKYIFQTLYDK